MTEDEVVDIALTTDRMARRIAHRFTLDDKKLRAWFSQEQIDRIRERIETERLNARRLDARLVECGIVQSKIDSSWRCNDCGSSNRDHLCRGSAG